MEEAVALQPFASVTVSEYEPAVSPERFDVVAPLLHVYVNGLVPPVTLDVAVPFAAALHSAFVELVLTDNVDGCDTVVVDVAEHPFASVTVTE